ncbi:Inositol 2-dehydrogenase [Anaerohalosphaera lusitana]|uniref:Inositol 2-dehydrogenase n=1 Tax=Anaerohalosphaera lusitana TaxID=1936003 RepID=A0A1U9NNT2_9BACT|nr:Gfo/Idh/MocA family oxidoreductase [Anaerohalosphaera lusitana]AQT69457.1 Inositol 2-dehydrogenase [Anaerohalosphaera lusitana]
MLNGGVIGFGRMGITHYAILNTHPAVNITCVCESSNFVRKQLKRYADVNLYGSYKKMLSKEDLHFVIVATPTAYHADIVSDALDSNTAVFVEKPLALRRDESSSLTDKAASKNAVNQVGYFLRFNEVFKTVKDIVDHGYIGDVIHYKNEMYGRTVLKSSKSWRSKGELGGGCILDFASHCIDLAQFMFGPVSRVGGSMLKTIYSEKVEDAVYTMLEHENGLSGNVMVTWSDESYRKPFNRIEILGSQGKIIADRQEYRLYLRKDPDPESPYTKGWNIHYLPELDQPVRYSLRGSEFTLQLDHFIQSVIENDTQGACTFEDGERADRVIDMIREDFISRSA